MVSHKVDLTVASMAEHLAAWLGDLKVASMVDMMVVESDAW